MISMKPLIRFLPWLRRLLERDWPSLRRFYRDSLIAFISGILISLIAFPIRYQLYTDVEYLLYTLRDVNSYPLLQLMGGLDAAQRLSFALRTNLISEPLLLILPGLLMLSYPLLILKFLIIGLAALPILLDHPQLILAFVPIILLEAAGFTLSAIAGEHLGRALLRPGTLYGEVGRIKAFKRALGELLRYYSLIVLVLGSSSILEVCLSLLLDIFR